MSAENEVLSALETLIRDPCAEILCKLETSDGERVPALEIKKGNAYGSVRLPIAELSISTSDLSEKDRIIKNERYLVNVTITVDGEQAAFRCYRYADAFARALREDSSLGGIAASAILLKKDYRFPAVEGGSVPFRVILSVSVSRESV